MKTSFPYHVILIRLRWDMRLSWRWYTPDQHDSAGGARQMVPRYFSGIALG